MTSKALLVGINDYSPRGQGGPDLQGCVADVQDIARTLVGMGLLTGTPSTLRILTDLRATLAGIKSAVQWLVAGASKGDRLLWYYSGHGSWTVDANHDEPDGHDEALVPCDYRISGLLCDDQINDMLMGVPKAAVLEVIFDSCFSGTATKAAPKGTPRFLAPPLDHAIYRDLGHIKKKTSSPAGQVPENHVLWAACKDNQTSAESEIAGGGVRGAFTYRWCRALRKLGRHATRKQLLAATVKDLAKDGFDQTPSVSGPAKILDVPILW